MGQKINPISLRTGIVKPWVSRWFFVSKGKAGLGGKYPYAAFLAEDEAIRAVVRKRIVLAGIAGIDIERTSNHIRVFIKAARPGLIIGQGGKGIEELTKTIEKAIRKARGLGSATAKEKKNSLNLSVNVEELKRSEISSAYIAQQIAWDAEKRLPFRRTMRKYLESVMQNRDVKGAKIMMSGRLDGAEIARREMMKQGPMPLQTLRADIDYGTATAFTTYGTVGIEVWVYKGEVFEKKETTKQEPMEQSRRYSRS